MYDVFILGLMTVGISSVVVFSYKIFHSRVYPVGIVRRMPVAQECVDERSAELPASPRRFQQELMSLLEKEWSIGEIADLHLSETDIEGHLQRVKVFAKNYSKQRRPRPQSGREQYRLALRLGETASLEREDSALEVEVKLHSKQFEDFEKRIRRLEIESVQKVQEAAEEKPQPQPPVVH